MRKKKELKSKIAPREQRRCATPGCPRLADDGCAWTEGYCSDCALGRELFDRGERRERIFAGANSV